MDKTDNQQTEKKLSDFALRRAGEEIVAHYSEIMILRRPAAPGDSPPEKATPITYEIVVPGVSVKFNPDTIIEDTIHLGPAFKPHQIANPDLKEKITRAFLMEIKGSLDSPDAINTSLEKSDREQLVVQVSSS